MAQQDQERLTEAIQWRLRLRDGSGEDWEAFVLWLESDPAHSAAYDAVALADGDVQPEAMPGARALAAANDDGLPSAGMRRGRPGAGWLAALAGIAAMFLIALLGLPWLTAGSSRYEIVTRPGEQRTVETGDGTGQIAMNGATRIILDRDNARFAELAAGEATFTVRHDSRRPFMVVAGDHRVQDAGTVFNLVRDQGRFSVEVAEGAIVYNPSGAALSLRSGETLIVEEKTRRIVRDRMNPEAMAGWRRGQLSFRHAPLAAVAREMSRSIGIEIRLDPAIADRPFTGSIRVDGDPSDTMERLAATLDVQPRRTGAGWLIEPGLRARR